MRGKLDDLLRRSARRRQDVHDARGGAHRARPEARRRHRDRRDPRPIRHGGAGHRARDAAAAKTIEHRGIKLEEFDLDAALARRPAAGPRRRAGAHERARVPPPEALARRRGAARRRDRRLHDAQRPAPREPQRRRRADHGRHRARDGARRGLRQGLRGARSWTCRWTSSSSASQEGKVYVPDQARARDRELLPRREPDRAARARAPPDGRARRGARCAATRPRTASRRPGTRASGCSCASRPSPHSEQLMRAARRMADEPPRRAGGRVRRDARVAPHVCGRPRAPRREHAPRRAARGRGRDLARGRRCAGRSSATLASATSPRSSSANRRTRGGATWSSGRSSTRWSARAAR